MSDRFVNIVTSTSHNPETGEESLYLFAIDEDGRVWQYDAELASWGVLPNTRLKEGEVPPRRAPAARPAAAPNGAPAAVSAPAPAAPSLLPGEAVGGPAVPARLAPVEPPIPGGVPCACVCGACRRFDHANCSHVNPCAVRNPTLGAAAVAPVAAPAATAPAAPALALGDVIEWAGQRMRVTRCAPGTACLACQRTGQHLEPLLGEPPPPPSPAALAAPAPAAPSRPSTAPPHERMATITGPTCARCAQMIMGDAVKAEDGSITHAGPCGPAEAVAQVEAPIEALAEAALPDEGVAPP